ncbi:MAG: UDP-N-acetylmuramate dehydrogenase [Flavobacteriales bacterium]
MFTRNQSLRDYHTFGLAAEAEYFVSVRSTAGLKAVLKSAVARENPLLFLGGGSNILFTRDFDGLVVHLSAKGKRVLRAKGDSVFVQAQAGEDWHEFVCWTLQQGFGGLENLSLIPGRVGAAPIQNIGAYGAAFEDVFYELSALEIATNEMKTFTRSDCQFGYRDSVFKGELKGRYVVLSVIFQLTRANHRIRVSYGAIRDELQRQGIVDPSIQELSRAVVAIRQRQLPNPKELGNSGSFFKNPVVSTQRFETLKARYPDIPAYRLSLQKCKLSAAWLIERAGWKGYRKGDVGVYEKQALVLVNHGEATGAEVLQLARAIQADVRQKYGIELDVEVNLH